MKITIVILFWIIFIIDMMYPICYHLTALMGGAGTLIRYILFFAGIGLTLHLINKFIK